MNTVSDGEIVFFGVAAFIIGLATMFAILWHHSPAHPTTTVTVPLVKPSSRNYIHSLKHGPVDFTIEVKHPIKAILYPESQDITVSYLTACAKDGKLSAVEGRSFTTPYTRNMLYKIPAGQDSCQFTVKASTPKNIGQIVVDVTK